MIAPRDAGHTTRGTGHPGTGHPGTGHPGTGHPGTGHPGTEQPSRPETSSGLETPSGPETPLAGPTTAAAQIPSQASGRSLAAGLALLLLCSAALLLAVHSIGPEQVRDMVAVTGPWAPIVYILLKASTIVVTPLSGTPLRLTAGALFGFWDGVLYSVAGSVLGGSINFWIARRFGRAVVARLLGRATLARVEPMVDRLASWRMLVLARIVLAPLWDVLCYGAGLTRLRYRTFLVVAALADVVPTMILVAAGASLMEAGAIELDPLRAALREVTAAELLWALAAVFALGLTSIAAALLLRPRLARLLASVQRP